MPLSSTDNSYKYACCFYLSLDCEHGFTSSCFYFSIPQNLGCFWKQTFSCFNVNCARSSNVCLWWAKSLNNILTFSKASPDLWRIFVIASSLNLSFKYGPNLCGCTFFKLVVLQYPALIYDMKGSSIQFNLVTVNIAGVEWHCG